MLFQEKKLTDLVLTKDKMNRLQIITLMNSSVTGMDKSLFKQLLVKQGDTFTTWVDKVEAAQIQAAHEKISPIADLRYLLQEYITCLESSKISSDPLQSSRVSIIKRLSMYLNDQSELTDLVRKEITIYVNQIREMKPANFEEQYLAILSPLSFSDNTWRWGTDFALSIFNLLKSAENEALTTLPTKVL